MSLMLPKGKQILFKNNCAGISTATDSSKTTCEEQRTKTKK